MESIEQMKAKEGLETCFHEIDVSNYSLGDIREDILQVRNDIATLNQFLFKEDYSELSRKELRELLRQKKAFLSGLLELKAFKLNQKYKEPEIPIPELQTLIEENLTL
jgi:hypothetical protein